MFIHLIKNAFSSSKARMDSLGTNKEIKEKDIHILQFGDCMRIAILSEKGIDEFKKVPTYICDRADNLFHSIERVAPKSFTLLGTTKEWKIRRDAFVK